MIGGKWAPYRQTENYQRVPRAAAPGAEGPEGAAGEKKIASEDQKRDFLTKNETTFLRARDGEGAKSCGSDRFVVVSAVTSSCELGDLLLHAETAGKQLITDIANVPLVCAMKVLNLINDGSCTLLCSFVPASWTGISTSLRLHLHCRSVFVLDSNPLQR